MSEMEVRNEEIAVNPEDVHVSVGIAVITSEILFYKQQAGCAIIEIGRLLIQAKEQLKHGEWLPWLRDKVDFSERLAQTFMQCAKEYGENPQMVAGLGVSKALALLALPVSEREDFVAEKHEVNGEEKTVAEMTNAELKKAIRERDAALKEVQELRVDLEDQKQGFDADVERMQAEIDAAQQARDKMAEDVKFLNERVSGLTDEVAQREQELKELRDKPVEVAVQEADPAELEKARKEAAAAAEQKMAAEIKKAEQALTKAKEEKAKAEEESELLQARLDTANAKLKTFADEVERARKEAQLAGDKELSAFTAYFEQAQETTNKMIGILQRMDYDGRKETADKLRKAMNALAEKLAANGA